LERASVQSFFGDWLGVGTSVDPVSYASTLTASLSASFFLPSAGLGTAGFGTAVSQNVLSYVTGALLFTSASLDVPNFGAVFSLPPVGADFAEENHDRFGVVTDDEHTSPLQGTNMVPWNPFPIPPPLPAARLKDRDETRFKKVSSFTRVQPFRVRITRDR
jgi:hypothetical protein